ncbi:MAG TPA: amidohydrolase [Chitinophagaceae bacterium]|nr:amidohydrolase [Chitinophagaceae bacterium]
MSITFTLIQTKLHWEVKLANLMMLEEKINSIQQKTEVVILPEMFSTGFSMQPEEFAETMDGTTIAWMKKIAANKKIILTGSLIIEENKKYFNRLIWMLPNGTCGYYDKRHCFAYAGEHEHYTPGNKRLIAQVKGWKINLQICYDLRFPVWARQSSDVKDNAEYDVLLYVANWPERRNHAWKTLLTARAIENQCYVIGVNRVGNDGSEIYHSGDSMVIDPLGEIIYHKAHDEDIFTITLEKEKLQEVRNKFPFLKDADEFRIINDGL